MSFAKFQGASRAPHNKVGQLSSVQRFPTSSQSKLLHKPASRRDGDSLASLSAPALVSDASYDDEDEDEVPNRIHLFYDPILSRTHVPHLGSETVYERPERISRIYDHLHSSPDFDSTYMEVRRWFHLLSLCCEPCYGF